MPLAGVLLAVLACSPSGPPPYGLAQAPVQKFRFEAEETIDVDGEVAKLSRYADFELRAAAGESGGTLVTLFLDRYFTRVEGAPGGDTEMAISSKGLTTLTPKEGRQTMEPDAIGPGGAKISELRTEPVAAVGLNGTGKTADELWQNSHPILFGIHLLEWVLLALPPDLSELEAGGSWSASRELPDMGQYRVGIELPLSFRPDPAQADTVAINGSASRSSLRMAEGFEGSIRLDHVGQSEFAADRSLKEATLELRMGFKSVQGIRVESHHRVRILRLPDDSDINPGEGAADTTNST